MPSIDAAIAKVFLRMLSAPAILRRARFSVRICAGHRSNNPPMKRQPTIEKHCDRCEEVFYIPNIRQSRAREMILQFYPCPNCHYVPDILYPRFNKSGRCRDCSIPFSLIDHQAHGYCNRCLMKVLRHEGKAA